jgi:hypothetical protein
MYLLPLLIDNMAKFIYKTGNHGVFYLSLPECPCREGPISLKKRH